jgi:hypothetical protein
MNGFLDENCKAHCTSVNRPVTLMRTVVIQSIVAAIVTTVVCSWNSGVLETQVKAEPRRITPQEPDQHFKSGGRLSETVLQEILVVLKRIDERMERMEKVGEQSGGSGRAPATVQDGSVESRAPASTSQIQVRRSK